jgi:hypothetical protein
MAVCGCLVYPLCTRQQVAVLVHDRDEIPVNTYLLLIGQVSFEDILVWF